MFTQQHVALALRRERLLGRIAAERDQAARDLAHLKKPLAAADMLVSGVQFLKDRPWIAGVAAAAAVVAGRKRLWAWSERAWTAWRLWSRARRWLREQGYLEGRY
jgi:hypothetical protein